MALPTEHGGWSLTLEPVLLGLIVEPSWSGVLLGLAAFLVFIVRTPLKLALADRRRKRRLDRTVAAERFAALYGVGLAGVGVGAIATARAVFWVPVLAALPLVAIAFAYDIRSLSRRLVPELLGAIGIGSVSAAIVLAGGGAGEVAAGMWLAIASRATAAIFHVRVQLRRAKAQTPRRRQSDAAQIVTFAAATAGAIRGMVPVAGLIALGAVSLSHVVLTRRPPGRPPIIGAQQMVFGLTVVLATGLGAIAP